MIQQALSSNGDAVSWTVVNTHPHKERFAVESLRQQQFAAYCPMLLKRVRHARQTHLVLRPMFPAHVLAGLHVGRRWRPTLLTTPGVSTIVRSGALLSFLPAGFVETLQACEVDGRIVGPGTPRDDGQQVAEHDADYRALIATMIGMSERERVLSLFGLLRPAADVSGAEGAIERRAK